MVSQWKVASSKFSRLPEINTNVNRFGKCSDIIEDPTLRPRLQRSYTGSNLHELTNVKQHSFKQLTLQSIKELNENLLTRNKGFISSLQGRQSSDSVNSILERNYHSEFDGFKQQLGFVPHTPYFSKWKISGFKHDKVGGLFF